MAGGLLREENSERVYSFQRKVLTCHNVHNSDEYQDLEDADY